MKMNKHPFRVHFGAMAIAVFLVVLVAESLLLVKSLRVQPIQALTPTLTLIDGFEHQTLSTSGTGIWNGVPNPAAVTIDTTNKRTGAAALKVAEDGVTATYISKSINSQVVVGSLYIRLTANPSVNSTILVFTAPSNPQFWVTSTGLIRAAIQGSATVDGPNIVDGAWHQLDFRISTNSTTYTIEWSVDGTAQTTSSLSGQTAAAMTGIRFGSGTASHTATCWYDDVILSYTSADYPIGAHKVRSSVPNADGTDSGGTNFTLTGGTTNWEVLNEWPADTTTYIGQTTASSTSYREVQFADTTEGTIWGVHGYLAYFASGTTANNGTTQIVDSGGAALTNIYSGDMSETSLFYKSEVITAPAGGWTQANFNGVKGRVGFSSNIATIPRWSSLMLQYAAPEGAPPAVTAFDNTFSSSTNIDYQSTPGQITLNPGVAWGTLVSQTFDTQALNGAGFNSVMWNGDAGSGKVGIQIASSNSSTGPWDDTAFIGGAGCASTQYYEAPPATPIKIGCASTHWNKRYFRYKVRLCYDTTTCTATTGTSPTVTDVTVNWSK
jgi:hypothetical protein